MALRLTRFAALTLIVLLANGQARAETKTIARCGAGFLEDVDGYSVLHLKGTPYDMGYQQGALLRDDIRENVHYLFDVKGKEIEVELGGVKLLDPKRVISGIAAQQRKYVPERFFDNARNRRRGRAGRSRRHRRQLHSGAVSLFWVCPQRLGHKKRYALPRPDPRLRV